MFKSGIWFIKFFCYLILVILLNRITVYYDFLIYLFLFFFLSIILENYILFGISVVFSFIITIGFNFNFSIFILKAITFVYLTTFFIFSISQGDKRYLLEILFYKNIKSSKLIKKIYYKKIYKQNKTLVENKNIMSNEIKLKTKSNMKEIFVKSKVRYYGFYKKRTNFIRSFLVKEDYFIIALVFLVTILLFI